jgi:HK97 family phage prohead protease
MNSAPDTVSSLLHRGLRTTPSEPVDLPGQPVLDFIASDETLDRYREIIVASGWRLDAYRRNPVFQNSHKYGDVLFTLGKALVTEARAGHLFQRIEFAVNANPAARIAYALYRGKFLNAVSVGFLPLRWENGTADTGFRRKHLEQELLEVSAVAIPANPNALQLALGAGAVESRDLRDLLEALREHLAEPARLRGPAGGVPAEETRWLRLARDLQRLLRPSPRPHAGRLR